ncbi:hypothetical protein BaRGS_00032190, partial [Batillaria attramentaria]
GSQYALRNEYYRVFLRLSDGVLVCSKIITPSGYRELPSVEAFGFQHSGSTNVDRRLEEVNDVTQDCTDRTVKEFAYFQFPVGSDETYADHFTGLLDNLME